MIDISVTIAANSVVYPGDPPMAIERIAEIGPACAYRLTRLGWTTHFLTHIDAPSHFIPDGMTIDQIPLDRFCGPALVVEVSGPEIRPADLPKGIDGLNVLFKTTREFNYASSDFRADHAFIGGPAARALVDSGVNLVGIDYLDIERFGDDEFPAHRALLGNAVLVLEGIDLSRVEPGSYTLMAFPLKIEGADGSPVRALLVPDGLLRGW